ncbi:MAG: sigma factor-like helix-turn-helix DNA-binding protein [Bacillota bacterium]
MRRLPGASGAGELERLEGAARRLSPLEREVLVLSAGRNLGYDRIAALLGITPGRAERLLARALVKLDRGLREECRSRWRIW